MGWGKITRRYPPLNSFGRCLEEVRCMRYPLKGRKVQNGTTLRISQGTKESPEILTVRLHGTDLVHFHKDGSKHVYIGGWATSNTSRERLYSYANVNVLGIDIPAMNGYAVRPHKIWGFKVGRWNAPIPSYVLKAKNDYVHILPGDNVDVDSLVPIFVDCITEPMKMRKAMRNVTKLTQLLAGYMKLHGGEPFLKAPVQLETWLLDRYKTPIEEVTLSPLPRMVVGDKNHVFGKETVSTVKSEVKKVLPHVRYQIAKREGWLGKLEVLKIE